MTKYEKELSQLKPHDGINGTSPFKLAGILSGYDFISTYGHGYLVVPANDPRTDLARSICKYGYQGVLATYLEEDCELREFFNRATA